VVANFIHTTLKVILQIPISINMPLHIVMLIAIFAFSGKVIDFPVDQCVGEWLGPDPDCHRAWKVIKILMDVSGGVSILIAWVCSFSPFIFHTAS
jgi:hypothetical protein